MVNLLIHDFTWPNLVATLGKHYHSTYQGAEAPHCTHSHQVVLRSAAEVELHQAGHSEEEMPHRVPVERLLLVAQLAAGSTHSIDSTLRTRHTPHMDLQHQEHQEPHPELQWRQPGRSIGRTERHSLQSKGCRLPYRLQRSRAADWLRIHSRERNWLHTQHRNLWCCSSVDAGVGNCRDDGIDYGCSRPHRDGVQGSL